jgi:hypothetical protein
MNPTLTATYPASMRARNEERKAASALDRYAATVAATSLVAVIFAYLLFSSLRPLTVHPPARKASREWRQLIRAAVSRIGSRSASAFECCAAIRDGQQRRD